jgi:hypothetical protein
MGRGSSGGGYLYTGEHRAIEQDRPSETRTAWGLLPGRRNSWQEGPTWQPNSHGVIIYISVMSSNKKIISHAARRVELVLPCFFLFDRRRREGMALLWNRADLFRPRPGRSLFLFFLYLFSVFRPRTGGVYVFKFWILFWIRFDSKISNYIQHYKISSVEMQMLYHFLY